MEYVWELSEADTVTLVTPRFIGKRVASLNGAELGQVGKKALEFTLSDGRDAELSWTKPFVGAQYPSLLVDGEPTPLGAGERVCDACDASVRAYDQHCDACGAELPTLSDEEATRLVGQARNTIMWLAVIFAVSGVVMYFLQASTTSEALANLDGMSPDTVLEPVNGVVYTVAELRSLVVWESRSILAINLALAAAMVGLFFWAKKAPFPAIVAAAAVYAAVIVSNAVIDPATLLQGVVMKIIIVSFLARGIKSELHLRARAG